MFAGSLPRGEAAIGASESVKARSTAPALNSFCFFLLYLVSDLPTLRSTAPVILNLSLALVGAKAYVARVEWCNRRTLVVFSLPGDGTNRPTSWRRSSSRFEELPALPTTSMVCKA